MKKLLLPSLLLFAAVGCAQNLNLAGTNRFANIAPSAPSLISLPGALGGGGLADQAAHDAYRKQMDQLKVQFDKGDMAACESTLKGLLAANPTDPAAWYDMACVYSRTNRQAEGIDALTKAVDNGYCNFRNMQNDDDLGPLRSCPQFASLAARSSDIQAQRAQKIKDLILRQTNDRYACKIDAANRLIFASDVDNRSFDEIRTDLGRQAAAERNDLFDHGLELYVTIVVLGPGDIRKVPNADGWYDDHDHMILTPQTGIILTHEFTHALHHADQEAVNQDHPAWVREGLAALFESNQIAGGHITPLDNFRLRNLKGTFAAHKVMPLRQLFGQDPKGFMKNAAVCYPQSRYVMMYLYRKGVLKSWYETYKATYGRDRTGALAMEQVLGKPLSAIESDWRAWAQSLQAPAGLMTQPNLNIGAQLSEVSTGLEINGITPGGPAARAGLRNGDVVAHIGGRRVADHHNFQTILSAYHPGSTIKVEYIRDNRRLTTNVTASQQ